MLDYLKISNTSNDMWERHYFQRGFNEFFGYKIHINLAGEEFSAGKNMLIEQYAHREVDFKVCNTQEFCNRLNDGHYGVTQIGKAATIYVSNAEKLSVESEFLKRLFVNFSGPCPPTDLRVPDSSVLSYRWEAIHERTDRKICSGVPSPVFDPLGGGFGVGNPFLALKKVGIDLIVTRCVRQSSKGAVYQGIARGLSINSPTTFRSVYLKGYRRYAAKSRLGHDAWAMGKSEEYAYVKLGLRAVPELLWSGISNESRYILLEAPLGYVPLQEIAPSLTEQQMKTLFVNIESLMRYIFERNILWLDVSPTNILVSEELKVKAIDFEVVQDELGTTYYSLKPLRRGTASTIKCLMDALKEDLKNLTV